MPTYKNPSALGAVVTPRSAGDVVVNPFVFDFATSSYRPAAIAANDLILVGVVPANCKLVPHLCRFSMPSIDSGGAPTSTYSIGGTTNAAGLRASAPGQTAVVHTGEDLLFDTGELGQQYVDTPIYIKALTASQAVPTAGKIRVDLAIRAFDGSIDTDLS